MSYSPEAQGLRKVATARLPRVSSRISFLALDRAKVVQGRTGVVALLEDRREVAVPGGSLAVLLLGPGTSISSPALRTLANSGCVTIVSTGSGDGCYTTAVPLTSSGAWACAQATMWADEGSRVQAAKVLYAKRFDDELPDDVTLAQLRGFEGQRMKHVYREHAAKANLSHWRRRIEDDPGSVNANLNLANSVLYGVAAAVCSALGISPALGVIHQGATRAFLFDLADCYKTTVSIPVAFESCRQTNASAATLRGVREAIHRQRVLKKMTELCIELLEPYLPASGKLDVLFDQEQTVPGHKNYAAGAAFETEPF